MTPISRRTSLQLLGSMALAAPALAQSSAPKRGLLRDTYKDHFKIGCALNTHRMDNPADRDLFLSQFNSVSTDYELKMRAVAPEPGVLNFEPVDKMVDFAMAHNMEIRGHTLVWYLSTPDYVLEGSTAQIRKRLETYIGTVVDRYKGRIKAWDVVNEVVANSWQRGRNVYQKTKLTEALGNEEYIHWAFHAAHEADPDASLFLNDYSTEDPKKRANLMTVIERLLAAKLPMHGIGHQCHHKIDTDINQMARTIDEIDARGDGLDQHVTEFDVTIYDDKGGCWNNNSRCQPDFGPNTPPDLITGQARHYREFFNMLKQRQSITSVTMWGLMDGDTFLNRMPMPRTNAPHLFDRNHAPKPAFHAITDPNYVIANG